MEYFSSLKKIEITNFANKWMELENIIPSEITQIQTDKCCKLSPMCRADEILSACVLLTAWPYKGSQCLIFENGKALQVDLRGMPRPSPGLTMDVGCA